jgi:hypothetical protein
MDITEHMTVRTTGLGHLPGEALSPGLGDGIEVAFLLAQLL